MCVSNTRCIIHNTNKHVYIGIGIAIVSVIVCTSDSDNVYNNHGTASIFEPVLVGSGKDSSHWP